MKIITALTLKSRLDQGEVLLIDVREPTEHKSGYIEGDYLIPLSEIAIERLPSTERPIVIYCRSGKRSADACARLLEADPLLEVYSLQGGIIGWQQAGFNVQK